MFRRKSTNIDYASIHERYEDTALVIFKKQKSENLRRPLRSRSSGSHNRVTSYGEKQLVSTTVESNDIGKEPRNSAATSRCVDDNNDGAFDGDQEDRIYGVRSKVCVVLWFWVFFLIKQSDCWWLLQIHVSPTRSVRPRGNRHCHNSTTCCIIWLWPSPTVLRSCFVYCTSIFVIEKWVNKHLFCEIAELRWLVRRNVAGNSVRNQEWNFKFFPPEISLN